MIQDVMYVNRSTLDPDGAWSKNPDVDVMWKCVPSTYRQGSFLCCF